MSDLEDNPMRVRARAILESLEGVDDAEAAMEIAPRKLLERLLEEVQEDLTVRWGLRGGDENRTKRLILEVYDEMAEAARIGKPYQTRLAPPPANPLIAHPADTRPDWRNRNVS
jgi:hypothetical protein